MPPKIRITREMILDAAYQIVRSSGIERLTTRTISEQLNCSTQPVLYHFSTTEEIRQAVYERADQFHSDYILPKGQHKNPLMELGLNYVRFGHEEPMLFRFLFQTNHFSGFSLKELMEHPGLTELLRIVSAQTGCREENAKEMFFQLFVAAHGCASLLANNAMEYDEAAIEQTLRRAFLVANQQEDAGK